METESRLVAAESVSFDVDVQSSDVDLDSDLPSAQAALYHLFDTVSSDASITSAADVVSLEETGGAQLTSEIGGIPHQIRRSQNAEHHWLFEVEVPS